MAEDWPDELRLQDEGRVLAVTFESGLRYELPAEYLRVESPSAEVQGHSAAEKKTVAGKQAVRIASLVPVGNYAVKLVFDDGHDTGLYSWAHLLVLGREQPQRWEAYLKDLEAKGLRR